VPKQGNFLNPLYTHRYINKIKKSTVYIKMISSYSNVHLIVVCLYSQHGFVRVTLGHLHRACFGPSLLFYWAENNSNEIKMGGMGRK